MSKTFDIEADLRALEAMASNLTPYLYEKELFGTISNNLPRLTVGGLLLRLYRLDGLDAHLDDEQHQRLRDARINFEQMRSEWTVHYEEKISQEINSRLGNFSAFMDDYNESSQTAYDNYQTQALRRTMLYHLQGQAEEHDIWTDEFRDRLRGLDRRLREVSGGEQFILAPILEPVYARHIFWWLYAEPVVSD